MSKTKPLSPKKPEPDGESKEADTSVRKTYCDLCGSEMYEWHCRIVCESCGYQRDCSDP
jgi:hypothetical protein